MTKTPYELPTCDASGYNCPHCHAYAKQGWGNVLRYIKQANHGKIDGARIGTCDHCGDFTIWLDNKMIYPLTSNSPFPNADLPDEIKIDFEEARQIQSLSPRGCAALLRLCIQKLCIHLGEKGKNINDDISSLVDKGLSVKIQQALDIVRVVGNNAVHPGKIDLKDDTDISNRLFDLVNLIGEVMITQPKHIDNLYNSILPESQKEAIKKRDQ